MTTHTYAGHTLAEIKMVAEAATPGPWRSVHHEDAADHVATIGMRRVIPLDYSDLSDQESDSDYIATANPATVLAMAARIENLERELGRFERMATCGTVQNWLALPDEDKAKWFALMLKRDGEQCKRIQELEMDVAEHQAFANEIRHAVCSDGQETPHGLADKVRNRIDDLERERDTARLEGWQAAREMAVSVASETTQVYGVSFHVHRDVRQACEAIRAMQPPVEWQCAEVAAVCGAAPNAETGALTNEGARPESLCKTCLRANVSCPVYPLDTQHCVEHAPKWPHEDGFGGGLTERTENGQDHQG